MLCVLKILKFKPAFYAVIFVLLGILVIVISCLLAQKTFYDGVYIRDTNLSGLIKNEAFDLITGSLDDVYKEQGLTLRCNDISMNTKFRDFDCEFLINKAIDEAHAIGRDGNVFKRFHDIFYAKRNTRHVDLSIKFDKQKLKNILEGIKARVDKNKKDAEVVYKKGSIICERDEVGYCLDVDTNISLVENCIKGLKDSHLDLQVNKKMPDVTYEDIVDINQVISVFTTQFNSNVTPRTKNIQIACNKLNGTVLLPMQVFSMNRCLGPRTLENGYKEALVIYGNKFINSYGGGICQVSTTLYGAVLRARLGIVERTGHSLPLNYVELGQDATIAGNYIDFKFRNNKQSAVAISSEVLDGKIIIRVLGKKENEDLYIKLKSEIVEEYLPDKDEILVDESLGENERVVIREPAKGYKVVVYRETYNKYSELINKETISIDKYSPIRGQIKVKQ